MDKKTKQKASKSKSQKNDVKVKERPVHPSKVINRVTHVPMESVKMVKMGPGIVGTSDFSSLDYSINAGNQELWPRLATVARTYQMYRITKWHVRYEPIASMFGANKQGAVTLSTLRNWYDAPPDTMTAQTERASRSVTAPAWECATLHCEPTGWKYVREGPGAQGQDMRLDDVIVEVGIEGTDAASVGSVVGFIYVTAEIEFRTPYTVSALFAPRTNGIQVFERTVDSILASSPTGLSTALPWSGTVTTLPNSGYTGARIQTNSVILAGGTYSVRFLANGYCASSVAVMRISFSSVGGTVFQPEAPPPTIGNQFPLISTSYANAVFAECVVTVPEATAAVLTVNVTCIQAASASFTINGMFLIVIPH